jgi:dipeptidyl-peptidase-4
MEDKPILTLHRIFNSKEFDAKTFGPARWFENGDNYTTLETAASDDKIKEIIRYDIASTDRSILVTAEQLQPPGKDEPLIIENYSWSPDNNFLLIFTNSKRVWRENTRGDYWILELGSGKLIQLGGDAEPATLMFAKFSPNNNSVAYVRENNIFIETIASGKITQLTTDGSETTINGTSDWVYEEEFRLRDGFSWSPDSHSIAYWQFVTTGIETFYMINNTANLYPKLQSLPYPKAGTKNSACRVGVIAASGGDTAWFDVPGDPRNHYIPKMEWAANSDQVLIQQLNRLQNRNKLLLGDIATGSVNTVFVEKDKAWIDVHNDLKWLDGGKAFTWLSDRDGWRHLYRISRDGQEVTLLTPGAYDVISVQKIEEQSGWAYYIASSDNPTQRYLYRSQLDGNGHTERLTPMDKPGTHSYQISPKADYAFHTYSTFNTPPTVSLISLPEHKQLRLLEDNKQLHEAVLALKQPLVEFFRLTIEEGLQLDGWCIKPPDFNSRQKYPLLFFVYGEPASQTVLDTWGKKQKLWHLMLAQQGYLVVSLDNRGTPAPRGHQWRKGGYRQVGILTTADQAQAARTFIESRPYIDTDRIGVWGWSGGGSMTLNLMFKYPELYKTGIAVAAVSDQRYYDTIYQERYMGLPEENEEGFKEGSPITYAGQLEGNLLLIHGTADDNVHYQCFEALANQLIKHDRQFSMMAYPNRSHAIKEGKNTQHHLYCLMTRYLQDNLTKVGSAIPCYNHFEPNAE